MKTYNLKAFTADELRRFIVKNRVSAPANMHQYNMMVVVQIATDLLLLRGNISARDAGRIIGRVVEAHEDLPAQWQKRVLIPSWADTMSARRR